MFKLLLPRPLLVILFCFLALTSPANSQTLTGKDAIAKLRSDGAYESLSAAMKKASGYDAPLENPEGIALPTAVGLTQKVMASDAATGKFFGYSVAMSGSTAVVGSPWDDGARGAVYVFARVGTSWVEQQKIVALDAAPSNLFGYRVAMHGSTIAVTALQRAVSPVNFQGSVYVFTRSGGTWSEQQILTEGGGGGLDNFGLGLSIHGDTIVAGAPFFGEDNRGAAWVFTRTGGVWSQQAVLSHNDSQSQDAFGVSAAVHSDTIVIGMFDQMNSGRGAAYVFSRTGSTWSQQQKLVAADGAAGDSFGSISVGVSGTNGDTILVGAHRDDIGGNIDQGSAYIFTRSGTVWTQQQKLFDPNGVAEDLFGQAVAIDGDLAIVGAPDGTNGSVQYAGSATVFRRSGDAWNAHPKLTASDGATAASFGFGVAISGQFMVVGSVALSSNTGAAYFARVLGPSWSQEARRPASDGTANDGMGFSIAISGDTVVAGAGGETVSGQALAGAAYVFVRSGSSWIQQAKLVADDPTANSILGESVAIHGNTIVVGGSRQNNWRGAVYVFTRTGGTWSTTPQKLTLGGAAENEFFGRSVSVNGNTLVVGASGDDDFSARRTSTGASV